MYGRAAELRSVGAVIQSPDMRERATEVLAEEGFTVDLTVEDGAPVTVMSEVQDTGADAYTNNVVSIVAESESPELAAAAADAYAAAFVASRQQQVKGQIVEAVRAVKSKLAEYKGAAKESTDYLVLQQRLRDLEIAFATATGNFKVLVPAVVPAEPVEPQPLRAAVLGLGVGLFAAIGLAFLLEQFDTRLRDPGEITVVLRQPLLGRVPRISRKLLDESAVVTLKHPAGQIAEAFRVVRTNLDFMAVDKDIRSIMLTSCLQGDGKSIAVANLAVAMALAGKKVVLVDGDLRRPRQHSYFGLENLSGVSTVVTGTTTLADSLQSVELMPENGADSPDSVAWPKGTDAMSRLLVLTGGPIPPNPGEFVASRRFQAMLETLTQKADIVLVDSPAMLAVGDAAAIAARVDGMLFLVDMHTTRRPQLVSAADQLAKLPCEQLGIVVRVDAGKTGGSYYQQYHYYSDDADGEKRKRRRTARGHAGEGALKA